VTQESELAGATAEGEWRGRGGHYEGLVREALVKAGSRWEVRGGERREGGRRVKLECEEAG
jgi:hypothetical protein